MVLRPTLHDPSVLGSNNLKLRNHLFRDRAVIGALGFLTGVLQQARENGKKNAEVVVVG